MCIRDSSSGTRCAVRRGTSTRALWFRGRSHGACMLSAARRATQHERAAREQLPGPCDVVVHLRDELLDGLEADHRAVSYTHLRAHETVLDLVCRLLLEKKKT